MIDHSLFYSVESLPDNWDDNVGQDIFLQKQYLKALEHAAPDNISLFYLAFYVEGDLVGVATVQRVQLYLDDMFRNNKDSCLKERLKRVISKVIRGNILVVGNLTHTGQHGLYLDTQKASYADFLTSLLNALEQLKTEIKNKYSKSIRAYLIKDFFTGDPILEHYHFFESSGFYEVAVQPNMIMAVRAHWNSIENYISDLHKKYRDRYKVARKKSKSIEKRALDIDTIQAEGKYLYRLYKNVSDNARINTFILPEDHFYEFKKQLDNSFRVYGYYLDNKLIGFYTLILNNENLETYFLGYDVSHQYKYQLYLNMLYDMAQFGIENNFKNVIYARTAMAIKSSVGAKPKKMVMYLKHTNWLMNGLLKVIFKFMNPRQDWEERHPFR